MSLKKHKEASTRIPVRSARINFYTCEFFPVFGGISTYCHELAQAACRAGHRTTVYGPARATPPSGESIGYDLQPGDWQGNHNPDTIWRVRRLLARQLSKPVEQTHVLAEPGPILALGTLSASLAAEAQPILVFHGSEILRWHRHPLLKRLARRAIGAAAKVICVSRPIERTAVECFPESTEKLKAVPNALPHGFAKRAGESKPPEHKGDRFRLLTVGRFHPRKGFDHLIRALNQLPDERKAQLEYTIVGGDKSPAYRKSICKRAASYGIRLTCRTDVSAEALAGAYQAADAFALTSIPLHSSIEGFGLVYLEAGAYGLPCLAYDNGGVRDAVQHGKTGFLVQTDRIDALTGHIRQWMEDPQTRRRMGEANREFAFERTWDDVYAAIFSP